MAGDRLVDIFEQAMVLLAQKASDENKVDWAAILAYKGLDISMLARSCLQEDFKEAGEHLHQLLIVEDIGRKLAYRLAVGALLHGVEIEDRESSLAEHRLRVFGAVAEIYDAAAVVAKDLPELATLVDKAKFKYVFWRYDIIQRQPWGSF